jgi:hypothetical protein
VQASFGMRHCERQRPASHTPPQHSNVDVQAMPAAVQLPGRHSPATHRPSQQLALSLQAPPGMRHVGDRHTPPTHDEPWQQSPFDRQPSPGVPHPPPTQRPERQLPEQQNAGLTHDSPAMAQVHAPSRHSPLQHSFDELQPSTNGLHGSRHRPSRHSPRQQSDRLEQRPPNAWHIGVITVWPHPNQTLAITRRTKTRMLLP